MNQAFDTLYARAANGSILQWSIEVLALGLQVDIRKSYGQFEGAQSLRWERNVRGKNIGKSNATTPFEQAVSQAESTINTKKRKGYMTLDEAIASYITPDVPMQMGFTSMTEDIGLSDLLTKLNKFLPKNRTDKDGNAKPMRAQQYYRKKSNWTDPTGKLWKERKYYYLKNPHVEKEKGSIIPKFPCLGQPKINGVRCTIQIINNLVVIKSKDGKIYNKVTHINDFLNLNRDIFGEGEELILDGELYIHGEILGTISSAVNDVSLNTPRVVFILFDLAIEEATNLERWKMITADIKPKLVIHNSCPVKLIPTVTIMNDKAAQAHCDGAIKAGFEGSMFRQADGMYSFGGRPVALVKLKRVMDEEFIITAVIPQKKDPSLGNYQCVTKKGLYFDVTPSKDTAYKMWILANPHEVIGKDLTCTFYEWTEKDLPYHVIDNLIRDYE